jgi:hypothetical protein
VSNVIAGKETPSIGDLLRGEWQIRMVADYRVTEGPVPHLFFGCMNGKGLCGVPILPSPPNKLGFVWSWDGNRERPTLSPSIHCTTEHGGCGFHGFMNAGVLA